MGLASHHVRWALFACCWLGLALITGQVHARDFNTIQQQGTLRVLYWTGFESYLPRAGFPLEQEKAAVSRFAEAHKLQVEFSAIENSTIIGKMAPKKMGKTQAACARNVFLGDNVKRSKGT